MNFYISCVESGVIKFVNISGKNNMNLTSDISESSHFGQEAVVQMAADLNTRFAVTRPKGLADIKIIPVPAP